MGKVKKNKQKTPPPPNPPPPPPKLQTKLEEKFTTIWLHNTKIHQDN